jgi:hypothetical protein
MKKTDKKTENMIRVTLTNVCNVALDEVPGFKWITHFVNYDDVPSSLIVVCVFGTKSELSSALIAHHDDFLRTLITSKLRAANIQCKNSPQCVRFDSEETWEPGKYRLH